MGLGASEPLLLYFRQCNYPQLLGWAVDLSRERVCVCACPCVHTVDLAGVCVFATQSCPTLCDLTDSSLQAPLSVE